MDRASRHARHESGGAWLADSLERFVDSETRGAARADALARARDDDDARVGVARDGDSGARVSTTSRDDASAIARERERARVLLDYFQHLERFDAWVAVSNLWERREHAGVSDYLCARLYRETSDEALERYLSQMVTMWVHAVENKTNERGSDAGHLASFERMMVMTSRRSLRLATKICWLLAAAAGDSAESKAVLDFRDECAREAVKNGTWPAPFEERVPMGGESAGTEAATATTERGGSPPRNGRTGSARGVNAGTRDATETNIRHGEVAGAKIERWLRWEEGGVAARRGRFPRRRLASALLSVFSLGFAKRFGQEE